MKSLKSAITGATALAIVGAGLFLGAGAAHAAGTVDPSITGDPNAANGTISFYDASGAQITTGSLSSPFTSYAVASSATTKTGTTKATLFVATPDHTKTNSLQWFNQQLTAASSWPLVGAPAAVTAAEGAGVPAVAIGAGDGDLAGAFSGAVNDPTTGFDHIMQIRMEDSGPGKTAGAPFWQADLLIDTTAGTWTQVYPAPAPKISTSISTIIANPTNPAAQGTTSVALSATLSASDSTHPAGTVELFDGSTDKGPATLDATTGAITATATVADSGSYGFTFTFTPSGNGYSGSTSPALSYHVNGPAAATSTVVSGLTTGTVGSNLTYTAAISPAAAAGKVQFKVDGSNAGNPVTVSGGAASFVYSPTSSDGGHSIVVTAAFAPTDSTAYTASADTVGVTTAITAAAYTPDAQNVTVTVPAGTLVISTPYTVANPFKLGTLALSSDGTHYSASGNFGDSAAPATIDPGNLGSTTLASYPAGSTSNGVTITDTRAGSIGWSASVSSTDFTNSGPSSISGHLFSFSSVTPKAITGNNLHVTDITPTPVTDLGAGGVFAKTTKGPGTIAITGILGLANVPTSVQAGDYTATLTFTVT
jgi:hypothetical protein